MEFKGSGFKYFFNNESKIKEEIISLINDNTTVSIKGLDVFYNSPKKEITIEQIKERQEYSGKLAKEMVLKYESPMLRGAREYEENLLKKAEQHQEQNGGRVEGVEFPFDFTSFTKKNMESHQEMQEPIIEDYMAKDKVGDLNYDNPYAIWKSSITISREKAQKEIDNCNSRTLNDKHLNLEEVTKIIMEEKVISDWNKVEGIKEIEGKLDYELDWGFIQQMAERMSQNKGKYKPYNWKKLIDVEKLKQSLFRHTMEIMKGNDSDDGRIMGHYESLALNAMMICYQLKNNKK